MSKQQLCADLAEMIGDYRSGQIAPMDTAHVQRWVDQFPQGTRSAILTELIHAFRTCYMTHTDIETFLGKVAAERTAEEWRSTSILAIQTAGHSQREMLVRLDALLKAAHGFGIDDCGSKPDAFLYLDDAVYSGGRVKGDLTAWIANQSPQRARVIVRTIVNHAQGEFFATKDIEEAAKKAGKRIDLEWEPLARFEDRNARTDSSDVLRPKTIPAEAQAYFDALGGNQQLRSGNQIGAKQLFTSPAGRDLLEQEFLKAGLRVRAMCPNFDVYMRPLGRTLMKTTGYGTLFVTHRNIANNTPLVLWAGDPWYPLFPRITN